MVMLYSLWEDAQLWLGQYSPYWQFLVPKGWMLFFTPTLWHAVWPLLDHKSTHGSITYRGYMPTRVWLGGYYPLNTCLRRACRGTAWKEEIGSKNTTHRKKK